MIDTMQSKINEAADWFGSLTGFEQVVLVLLALAVFRLGGIRRDLRAIYREIAQPSKLPHFVSRRMPFNMGFTQRRPSLGGAGFGFAHQAPAMRSGSFDLPNSKPSPRQPAGRDPMNMSLIERAKLGLNDHGIHDAYKTAEAKNQGRYDA